jgi:dihydrofolate reductase/thymidylate synthase
MKFSLVVAADKNNGIGKNNTLVWKLPTDMKFFADVTTRTHDDASQNAVIMGRNTWESLPSKHRPLRNRINVVLSRNRDLQLPDGVILAGSLDEAMEKLSALKNLDHVFVIGGARVFEEAVKHPDCQTIYLTRLQQTFDCDVFFPEIDEKFFRLKARSGLKQENNIDFEFLTYERSAGAE